MATRLLSFAIPEREHRPDLLGAFAGVSLALAAFTGLHLALFLRRAASGGLDAGERAWALAGVALVLGALLNALLVWKVLRTPRGPGARAGR